MEDPQQRVPPIRQDLKFIPQFYRGELCYVVRDPVTDNYYKLRELEYITLKSFQKGMGVEEVRQEIRRQTGAEVEEQEVYRFVQQLQGSNLLKSKGMGDVRRLAKHARQIKRTKLKQVISNYLFVTIPLWDPDRTLDKLLPLFRLIIHPVLVFVWAVLTACGLWVILTNFGELVADAFSLLSGWNLLILSGVIFSTKFIHEMGHALTCKHLGGHVRAIGPAILIFQPCMYTDVTDAWLFPSKWDRLMVTAAGVISEIVLASIAALVWLSSDPGLVKQISYTVMVTCTISTVLFNANPLVRFDGYYALSDLIEVPNLRIRTGQYLGHLFDRYLLGIDKPGPDVPSQDRHILVFYGIARFLYRWIIIVSIGFFLMSIFAPLGVFMIASSLYGMVVGPIWKRGRTLQRQFQAGNVRLRVVAVLAAIGALLAGLFFIPVDFSVQAPCLVAPRQASIVRAPADGVVAGIYAHEGQRVEQGEVLAKMESPALLNRARILEANVRQCQTRARLALASNMADYAVECGEERKLAAELSQLRDQIERLTLRAPHAGTIVNLNSREVAAPRPQHMRVAFPPSDARIEIGQFEQTAITEGTGLMAVVDDQPPVLRTFVHERDVTNIAVGAPVRYALVSDPMQERESRLDSLKRVEVKTIVNIALTLADIGGIPVKPSQTGDSEPLVTLYIAEAPVAEQSGSPLWGLTGKAVITYGRGPVGSYLTMKVVRSIRLRLQRI